MVRTHALMENPSASCGDFLHPTAITSDLTRPQKKPLHDGLVVLLRAGRPIVCRMAWTNPTLPSPWRKNGYLATVRDGSIGVPPDRLVQAALR